MAYSSVQWLPFPTGSWHSQVGYHCYPAEKHPSQMHSNLLAAWSSGLELCAVTVLSLLALRTELRELLLLTSSLCAVSHNYFKINAQESLTRP